MIKIPGPIPIFISPVFWILAIAIGWFSSYSFFETGLWVVVILISVLVHEFGHALTAIGFGQHVLIELNAFGGLTVRRDFQPLKLWKEFLIVLNGPIAGFCLCGVSYMLLSTLGPEYRNTPTAYMLSIAVYINLFWTIVNLLPIQPLDGGKLLGLLLEGIFGMRGAKIALFISMVVAVVIATLFFVMHSFLAGSLFFLFAMEGYQKWRASSMLTASDQNESFLQVLNEGKDALDKGDEETALEKFMKVREEAQSGVLYKLSSELAGGIFAHQGNNERAYQLLKPLKKELSLNGMLALQHVSYQLGHFQESIALGNRVYQQNPDAETALLNAYAYARLGDVKPAIGWMQCAIKEGIPNPRVLLGKSEFDPIRRDPLFMQFISLHHG